MDLSDETVEIVARRLGLTAAELQALARKAPALYRSWKEEKKSGRGFRTIEAPFKTLKALQRRLLDQVLIKLNVSPMLFGGKGSSAKKAVQRHTNKPLVLTMDIADFFPSIKGHMIRHALMARGANSELARLLTRLITYKNHVPHGAPTSSCITRIVLHPVAEHIERMLQGIGHGADASIYVDDLTLSGPEGLTRLQSTISGIFDRYGFRIHPEKIQVMGRDSEQVSLGIKLNQGIDVPAAFLAKYRQKRRELGPGNKTVKGMKAHIRGLNPNVEQHT